MQIVVSPESIKVSDHERATGVIYFADHQAAFPEVGWNDFVDVLLVEWSRQLLGFAQNKTEQITLRFMDGPFAVRLSREAGGCKAYFERGDRAVVRANFIEVAELMKSLVIATTALLENPSFLTQMPRESSELRTVLNELQRAVVRTSPTKS